MYAGNYGLLGVLDYCHDTDAEFQAYKRSLKGTVCDFAGCFRDVMPFLVGFGRIRQQVENRRHACSIPSLLCVDCVHGNRVDDGSGVPHVIARPLPASLGWMCAS